MLLLGGYLGGRLDELGEENFQKFEKWIVFIDSEAKFKNENTL